MASAKICSVDGCGKPRKGLGMCAMHLWRVKHHGSPHALKIKQPLPAKCSVEACEKSPERGRKGMCARHYSMMYRRGTTVAAIAKRGEPEKWLRDRADHKGDECLLWPFARHTDGSAAIGSSYSRQAARLMCMIAHGEPSQDGLQAAHSCGKGHLGCVNPKHLRWATPKQNTNDQRLHGTMPLGERRPTARLTELQVRGIKVLSKEFMAPDLAEMFDVHVWTISDILRGKTWAWL